MSTGTYWTCMSVQCGTPTRITTRLRRGRLRKLRRASFAAHALRTRRLWPTCWPTTFLMTMYVGILTQESTDAERMAAYPAYRQSLEARYPLVCDVCAPRVQAHLEKNHQRVRSEALSHWIARHAAAASAPAETEEVPARRYSAWHTTYAALVLIAGTLSPLCVALALPTSLYTGSCAVACLPTWWDSCAAHKDRLDARAIRYSTRGERAWQVVQLVLWLMRLGVVYMWRVGADPRMIGALGVLHAVLCLSALRAYGLVPQAPLHLAPRPVELKAPAPADPVAAPHPLAALSLADEPRMGAPLDTLWQASSGPEAMDVDPEPEPPAPRPFPLAPPQFGGRMSSGLEDLFGQALRLDAPSAAPSAAWLTPSWRMLGWLWLALCLSGMLYVAWRTRYDISTWAGRWGRS